MALLILLNKASIGADLIILSVPVGEMRGVLEQIDLQDQIITDVGSVKGSFVKDVEEVFTKVPPRLIPGHPIAGSEKKVLERARLICLRGIL